MQMKATAADSAINTETYESVLKRDGVLLVHNKGDSMLPLICEGRDVIVIEPVVRDASGMPSGLKKNDVILFKMGDEYILHRIIRIGGRKTKLQAETGAAVKDKREAGYPAEAEFSCIACGDHRICPDPKVAGKQILGIMTGLIRNGNTVNLRGITYRSYVGLWCNCFFLRKTVLRVLWKFSRLHLKCL